MKYITNTLDFQLDKQSVVTLGKFDGLHRGHDKLLSETLRVGQEGYETVVFTFDVSPLVRLGTKITRTLLTNEERKILLEKKGIDCLIECPFVDAVIHMAPEDFIRDILVKRLHVACVIVGPDFHFGYQRMGTPQLLADMGKEYGFTVMVMTKEMDQSRVISSTWIRETLREGKIEKVNRLLGYPYFVKETVVHGRHLGSTWGLPTINQRPENGKLLPPFGVYATRTYVGGNSYFGISNVGVKPTVEVPFAGVETFLFDCHEDLYDQDAWVEFYHFVRPECKFDSVEELREQIQRDALAGKEYFCNWEGRSAK